MQSLEWSTPFSIPSFSLEITTVNNFCVSFQIFPMYLPTYLCFIFSHKWDSYVHILLRLFASYVLTSCVLTFSMLVQINLMHLQMAAYYFFVLMYDN